MDASQIERASHRQLVSAVMAQGKRIANLRKRLEGPATELMGAAVCVGAAAATGYLIGSRTRAGQSTQVFGVDIDAAIGGTALAIGLTGLGGKKMSGAAVEAGKGALSLWVGNLMEEKAASAV